MRFKTAEEVVGVFAPDYSNGEENSAAGAAGAPLEVFYSYSHKDDEFRIALENHLSLLQRQGLITAWHDRRIGPGGEWREQIDSHLRSADLILLLISADFLASDYCFDVELKCALDRHKAGAALVIPIVVRHVDWSEAPFAGLQALPRDGKAISSWPDRDEALMNVAQGVRAAVQNQASHRRRRARKSLAQNGTPAVKRTWRSGKAIGVSAANLLPIVLGSLWAHSSNGLSTLPKDTTVANKLERGKYLYSEKKYEAASELFRQAAGNGSVEAADDLGIIYEFGLGTQPDCKEAKRWFQKGAKGNSSTAMDHLGMLFEHGCGVKIDNEEARRWFEEARSSETLMP